VIADYKAREEKKGVKSDEKEKDKDKKEDKEKEIPKPTSPIPSSPAPTPAASHRKFALHRQIFEMRRDDIKRKEQGVKAREVGKGMLRLFGLCVWELICRSTPGPQGDVLESHHYPITTVCSNASLILKNSASLGARAEEKNRSSGWCSGLHRTSNLVMTSPITTINI
jgi:hypothetical protein